MISLALRLLVLGQGRAVFAEFMDVVRLGDYDKWHIVSAAAFCTAILIKLGYSHNPPVYGSPRVRHFSGMTV